MTDDEWKTWANDGEPPPRVVDVNGQEHGLAVACYRKHDTGAAGSDVWPTLECACGRWFAAESWQDAGEGFDDHLEDVADGPA